MLGKLGCDDVRPLDIHLINLVQHVVLAVDQQARTADAGIIEQTIDLPERLDACLDRSCDLGTVGSVCLNCNCFAASSLDFFCTAFRACQIHIDRDDLCTISGAHLPQRVRCRRRRPLQTKPYPLIS